MTTYLLAIGINQYTDRAFRTLSCCENDATELHSLFKRNLDLGDRARKLVGAVSIADVKKALRHIEQEIRNGDTFVFFFAGHGYQHPRKEDQYLLFPDADAILVNKGHRDGMLSLSALRDLTEHWTGVARVFILDACRSWLPGRGAEGARFDNEAALAFLTSRSPGFSPALEKPDNSTAPSGGALPPVILNATRNGQEAKELENRQRGVLALALEQSLESQHQAGQVIYLGERLLGDISRRMNELLQHGRLGVEQTPFLTPPTAQVLLFKPPRPAAATPPVADEDDDETDWAITCAKGRLEDYETYARRKPPGKHRADALKKIAELSQTPKPEPLKTTQEPPSAAREPETVSATRPQTATPVDNAEHATPAANTNPAVAIPIEVERSIWNKVVRVMKAIVAAAWAAVLIGAALNYALSLRKPDNTPVPSPAAIIGSLRQTISAPTVGTAEPASPPSPLSVFRDKLKGGGEGPALVVIPAGEFEMGSNDSDAYSDERPVHRVSIKQTFALGKTEITQQEWRQVMGSDPTGLRFKGCDDCPVEYVSWNDAQSYIKKLNEQTGKTKYRLPSEAEWEYACRGGKANDKYCGGNDVDAVAWYDKNSGNKTRPVAQKQANSYGLYDMSGNVHEWVEDWYHDSYNGAPKDGSAWVTGGEQKNPVLRGGSWAMDPAGYMRSASRYNSAPDYRNVTFGFRVARTLP